MKTRIRLITLLSGVILFNTAKAQDDSTHYDLSRISVNKAFTQNTSITGSDLEKYQGSDLSDAINVWLYGTYTKSASLIYVVDGNIINDVNIYSIFDIEEVTLVQTALAQASGAGPGQQMVLIKTRTHRPGKKGIVMNSQNSLVNLRNTSAAPGAKSTTNGYEQYYMAAYKNFTHGDMGITADFQHDVDPAQVKEGSFTLFDPSSFKRYKFSAYADANLWKGSTLAFSANYVPQVNNYSYTENNPDPSDPTVVNNTFNNDHSSQHMAATHITINSHVSGGLSNRFVIAYNHYNYLEADSAFNLYSSTGSSSNTAYLTRAADMAHNLLIRNNIYYRCKLGNFNMEPALNFTYRNFSDSVYYRTTTVFNEGTNTAFSGVSQTYAHPHYSVFLVTPSVNIYYKDILNIQGGFTGMLGQGKAAISSQASHVFPFYNFYFDAAKFLGLTYKLSFHFSYARQSELLADDYSTLLGSTFLVLNPTQEVYSPNVSTTSQSRLKINELATRSGSGISVLNPIQAISNPNNLNPNQLYNNYHTGVDLGVTKDFSITYSAEFKGYTSYAEEPSQIITNGFPATVLVPVSGKIVTNRFTLNYNYHSSRLTWNAMLNGTETELHVNGTDTNSTRYNATYLSNGHRWSGGFTNRFAYQYYFMGIDFLYQAGSRPYSLIHALETAPDYIPPVAGKSSFALQNFYIGAKVKIPHLKYAEIYASGRNMVQNVGGDITDGRRFYGLGFKAGF